MSLAFSTKAAVEIDAADLVQGLVTDEIKELLAALLDNVGTDGFLELIDEEEAVKYYGLTLAEEE